MECWLASPSLEIIGENPDHWATLSSLLRASCVTGPRVHDARAAAIALRHAVTELWSVARDFSRFKGLRVVNPLMIGRAST